MMSVVDKGIRAIAGVSGKDQDSLPSPIHVLQHGDDLGQVVLAEGNALFRDDRTIVVSLD